MHTREESCAFFTRALFPILVLLLPLVLPPNYILLASSLHLLSYPESVSGAAGVLNTVATSCPICS